MLLLLKKSVNNLESKQHFIFYCKFYYSVKYEELRVDQEFINEKFIILSLPVFI